MAEAGSGSRGGKPGLADCNGFAAWSDALVRGNGYVNRADIVLRACESGCIVDGGSAGAGGFVAAGIAVVLGDDEEPCDTEGSSVCGVDYTVEDVEAGECQTVER